MVTAAPSTPQPADGEPDRFGRWTAEVVHVVEVNREAVATGAIDAICAGCQTPIGGAHLRAGQHAYHPRCLGVAPDDRCPLCGGALAAGFAHNGRGTRVCLRHLDVAVWCRFCRALAAEDGRGALLPRGLDPREGPICAGCAAGAVTTDAVARALFAEVVSWLPSQGLDFPSPLGLRVALADEAAIENHRPSEDPDTYGRVFLMVRTVAGRRTEARAYKVFLLRGLPPSLLQSVAAHELGHAWLAAHGVLSLPRADEEGFCEVVAHRWLAAHGTDEAAFHAWEIERQRDTVYGEGFRRVAAIVAAVGWATVVRSLRAEQRLPTLPTTHC